MWTADFESSCDGSFEDVDRGWIEARGKGVDLDRLRRAPDVQGGKTAAAETPDAWRQIEGLLHFALQAIHLGEQIAREQGSIHGENLHTVGPDGASETPPALPWEELGPGIENFKRARASLGCLKRSGCAL